MNVTELLSKIKLSYQAILGPKLTGIYVHGSLAFGCFRWEGSDIDFLVVVSEPLTLSEKEALVSELLRLDPYAPSKGFEMSVVLECVCTPFLYPTPFELHFSNAHKVRCRENLTEYCHTMNGTDPDLAAHITVIRHAGQLLCGKPIDEVFSTVPKANYLDSIRDDIADAPTEILNNPVYYTLNLCRVSAYLKDGLILSKDQGGIWGLENCAEYSSLIQSALSDYRGEASFYAEIPLLRDFADHMLHQIL